MVSVQIFLRIHTIWLMDWRTSRFCFAPFSYLLSWERLKRIR